MRLSECLTLEELESLVASERQRQSAMRHVLSCPSCRGKLEEIRADAELASELQATDAARVTRRKRSRLVAICRHAADQALADANECDRPD